MVTKEPILRRRGRLILREPAAAFVIMHVVANPWNSRRLQALICMGTCAVLSEVVVGRWLAGCMGFLWLTGFSFFHCVASPFHSFVTSSWTCCSWTCYSEFLPAVVARANSCKPARFPSSALAVHVRVGYAAKCTCAALTGPCRTAQHACAAAVLSGVHVSSRPELKLEHLIASCAGTMERSSVQSVTCQASVALSWC